MSMHVRIFWLCAALVAASPAEAKPPDLPLEEKDRCREHRPRALPAEPTEAASADDGESAAVIDTVTPVGGLLLVRYFSDAVADTLSRWVAYVREAFETGDSEEAEEAEEGHDTTKCVEVRVAELLEACQRAYADGKYREAADLAARAVKLDPECAAAHSLHSRARRTLERLEKQ